MNQEIINQLLSSFGGMEIKINVTKNDKGLEIHGTVMPQKSDGNISEKSESETPDACAQKQSSEPIEPEHDYKVKSVKQSGKNSQLLELISKDGVVTAAYVKASDQGIKTGMGLNRVVIEQKNSAYGAYNLISGYQIAA